MTEHWKLLEDRMWMRVSRSLYESGELLGWLFVLLGVVLILSFGNW